MTGMIPNDLEMLADIPGADQYAPQPDPAVPQDAPQTPPAPADGDLVMPPPPQPQQQPAPVQAQPQQNGPSDWQQEVALYARQQRELLERQQQPQYAPQQQAPQWVDPADRPEVQQRLNDLYQRLSYDEQAQREFNQLQAQMTNERVQHQTAQQLAEMQAQMQYMVAAPTVTQSAFTEMQAQYGQNLHRDHWDAVVRETFGDNAQAIARALDTRTNPGAAQVRSLLADAAAYRAVRLGQAQPAQPQPRAVPPAQVQSAARNPAPSRASQDYWSDPAYMQSVMDRAYDDPYQFIRRTGGQ